MLVKIGDVASFYAAIERVGTTSLAVRINAEVLHEKTGETAVVTEGVFVYVALDSDGKPTLVVGK